ncbi:hypothetical protein EW146_g8816 [Bondarzewia mesenterica]|uniref:RNase H type-1 domain-containing protein n=1 Tax=Bondarzewia mesenterica TaxID=1095465 RepID=A0A4S4LBF9_9AGAM|nr:hypothetical protein EW146_g8816 [Bondarzewia mesenterica]
MHIYNITPSSIEMIHPFCHHRPSTRPAFTTHIEKDKKAAISADRKLKSIIRVYTDGSAINGKVGAAAYLYREDRVGEEPKKLFYHLGSVHDHTVFEAEAVGLTLAAKLIQRESVDICQLTSISLDNQAAIAATDLRRPKSGYHILDTFNAQVDHLQDTRGGAYKLQLHWVPRHEDVARNEAVDKAAKQAAKGKTSLRIRLPEYLQNESLPASISARRQAHQNALLECWKKEWEASP